MCWLNARYVVSVEDRGDCRIVSFPRTCFMVHESKNEVEDMMRNEIFKEIQYELFEEKHFRPSVFRFA